MELTAPGLADFIEVQRRDYGGNVEVAPGLWALFGVPANDEEKQALARGLLADAPFAHDSGHTEDDRWVIHYVDAANRAAALHWLDDYHRRLAGEVREPSPAQRTLIQELAESSMPHRVAQKLAEEHAAGRLSAGCVGAPAQARALLDRLHMREPLYYSAFQLLLEHHLIDMVVLLQQLIPEDVELTNEAISGSISRDPFVQSRQTAAVEIRRLLIEFCVINALDQQKNTAIKNPYAAYMDVMEQGGAVMLAIDGTNVTTDPATFISAIHSIRRNLYLGGELEGFDTQAPWVRPEIAHPFRFIKRRLELHRDLTSLDGLYMLERAMAT